MTSINELRICKSRGNVFSKKAGSMVIIECSQCKGTNFEQIENSESEMYLDALD